MLFHSHAAERCIAVLYEPGFLAPIQAISLPSPISNRKKRLSQPGEGYKNTTSSFKVLTLSMPNQIQQRLLNITTPSALRVIYDSYSTRKSVAILASAAKGHETSLCLFLLLSQGNDAERRHHSPERRTDEEWSCPASTPSVAG